MFKKVIFVAGLVALLGAPQAFGGILSVTQAELLGMVIDSEFAKSTIGADALTPGPGAGAFDDGAGDTDVMSGVAGSNEFLGNGGFVYYTLNAVDLAAFNAASAGGDTFRAIGFNDNNNDNWELGIWYRETSGSPIVEASALVDAGVGQGFSLVIPDTVDAIGVFVRSGGITDQFHASWIAPEPGAIAIWSMLAAVGFVGVRRRRAA